MTYKSDFLNRVSQRYECEYTNVSGLDNYLFKNESLKNNQSSNERKNFTAYVGFDCTAPSLHVGSLVQIMLLRLLQKCGHKVIVLLGGGTTKIGDPSGKDKSRAMLNKEVIERNKKGIKSVLEQFIIFDDYKATIVDNNEWLADLNYIEFLRNIGKHISVNNMLRAESVKARLEREQHLSFLEFNYMLLQAYDFVELNKRYCCRLQLGGSDQWGNIISGIDLGRKLLKTELFGLTTKLVTTANGAKMGKTSNGAIWLDSKMCSPYDYWQYFRNIDDRDVKKFILMFTEDSPIDIKEENTKKEKKLKNNQERLLTSLTSGNSNAKKNEVEFAKKNLDAESINNIKENLATKATIICHGEQAAQDALNSAIAEFKYEDSSLLPTLEIPDQKMYLFKLITQIGFSNSHSKAKQLIRSRAVKINDEVNDSVDFIIQKQNVGAIFKISVGKKRIRINFS